MQSSATNWLKLRLRAAIQSARLSFAGVRGVRPARAGRSVALDKAEATGLRLRLALAAPPEQQSRRRADTSRKEEACAERSSCRDRQVRPQLGADVRRFAEPLAQRVRGGRELVALGLEIAADVLGGAAVTHACHRPSARRQ